MANFPHANQDYAPPKGYTENLKWRRRILTEAAHDLELAACLKRMCAEDIIFYINGFCWTYDPRDQTTPDKPFITYPFQEEAIGEAVEAIELGYDIAWPKSRTMGASWMGLTIFEHFWHFKYSLSFLLVSRTRDYVDLTGNPKSLFWKIDYLHANQARWLLPTGRDLGELDPNRIRMHMRNADTKSVINGESTTGDLSRGDRRTAIFIDEHAAFDFNEGFKVLNASRDASRCRVFNSTPQGANNAFYEVVHNSAARVYRMHWTKHPVYNRGLYQSVQKSKHTYRLEILDKDFRGLVKVQRKGWSRPKLLRFPEQYPFILDGKTRSPWYDTECARCVSDQEIAQELDIDFLGSSWQFFDQDFIRLLMEEYCVPYILRGRLAYDTTNQDAYGFEIDETGPMYLWFNLPGNEQFLTKKEFILGKRFAIGADISHGTGASNSVASIVDLDSGRKVALWKSPHADPTSFADEVVAMAKWFNEAQVIWDGSGPSGKTFTMRIMNLRYPNIYYRKNELTFRQRATDQPGYYLNAEDRAILLREYRIKLQNRQFINPSDTGMMETLQFIVEPGGRVIHAKSKNSQDPTGAREAHGDEVIADALAAKMLTTAPGEVGQQEKDPPYMSPAYRFAEEERRLQEAESEDW